MYHYEKVMKARDQSDIVWFMISACNLRRHWSESVGLSVGRVNRTFCFTGAIDVLQAQLFEGRLALNPGFFFFCSKTVLRIIFSAIFKGIQSSTC